jgi:2-octaprenyl-6-methoxyphenol hydroxylase
MNEHQDIVIAGGGMVGISLALQLAAALPESASITLVERFALPETAEEAASNYHPSFDARSTALSYSSRLIYRHMGVWDEIQKWLCPIERIHVSSKGHFGSALLQAEDYAWPGLGYVVENAWLGVALAAALRKQGRVTTLSPAQVSRVEPVEHAVELSITGADVDKITARLLIVADGANSSLCEQLGVQINEKSYGQCALVANVSTAQAHQGCAFERFTDEGPLALLPLVSSNEEKSRSALVWTLPPKRAAALKECAEDEFIAQLQDRFGYRLGRLKKVGERFTYPLSLTQSSEQVRQNVVVMGNAAHALHPVAGQGYNLALRDVAQLSRVLVDACAEGRNLGDLSVLQAYEKRQQPDQKRTIGFSDQVPSLFMQADPVLGMGRDLALAGLDFIPALKREFVRHAAGVAALEKM